MTDHPFNNETSQAERDRTERASCSKKPDQKPEEKIDAPPSEATAVRSAPDPASDAGIERIIQQCEGTNNVVD